MRILSPKNLPEAEIAQRIQAYAHPILTPGVGALPLSPRPAAVLVPLLVHEDGWRLLFTRRAETLKRHRGQVSFPGGVADADDDSPEATALREAYEEIGLFASDVHVIGRLAERVTVTNFQITPVVGNIPWPYPFQQSALEVSRIFTVPLGWLADPQNRKEQPVDLPGGLTESVIYFREYDGEKLWGATARIVVELLQTLALV
jgi:8-oxo-dGTP pyrophosphatase MutT (NUDIX family)